MVLAVQIKVGASFIVTINDFGELEEGDTVNFTCTWIGSTTPNTSLTYFYFFFNRDISGAFMNSTLNPVIEYDNSTQNYTTIFKVSNVLVDRRFNYQILSCFGNLGFAGAGKRLTVYYGPDDNKMTLWGSETGREGFSGNWKCAVSESYPAVNLTWYNGSTEFTPDSKAVVTNTNGNFKTEQWWKFTYTRDYTGSNVSCVATGYKNKRVTKSKQLQVNFAPELEVRGKYVYVTDKDTMKCYVDKGATLNLTCGVVAASPMASAVWSGRGSDQLVIINMPRHLSSTDFFCEAQNSVARSSIQVKLVIQYGPEFSTFSTMWVKEGKNFTVEAYIIANPHPMKISWRKEGSIKLLSRNLKLSLQNIRREQAGVYVVEATSLRMRENNTTEEVTGNTTVNVVVKYGPGDSVKLSPNLTTFEVDAGETVPPIACSAECEPACRYIWVQYYKTNTYRYRASTAVLNLGNASSSDVGIYMCRASNNVIGDNFEGNVTFELRVKYAPEIKSVTLNGYTGNPYSESVPITVTSIIRTYPNATITWGISHEKSLSSFLPLDSRYSANQTMTCTYDCEITAILTVFPPLCTDTGNKYSVYATNRKGNSTIKTTHYSNTIACTPRLANNAPMNQTYRTCEGAELNMTASFVSVPGPFISWYLLPNTRKYVHHLEGRVGPGTYTKVFYKTNYHIPVMYRHLFGTYLVEANNFRGSIAKTYIRVLKNSSCSDESTTALRPVPSVAATLPPNASSSKMNGPAGIIMGSAIAFLMFRGYILKNYNI